MTPYERELRTRYQQARSRLVNARPVLPKPREIKREPETPRQIMQRIRFNYPQPDWYKMTQITKPRRKSFWKVLDAFCREKRISQEELFSQRRQVWRVALRHEFWHRVSRECPHLSIVQIGKMSGDRDHTTVLHGIARHSRSIGDDTTPRGSSSLGRPSTRA